MSKKLTRRGGGVLNRLDKNYPLFIHKLGYKFFACLATLVFILSTLLLAFPELTNQNLTDAIKKDDVTMYYVKTGEIWNGTSFYETNLNNLLKFVSGDETASTQNISALSGNEKITELSGITGTDMNGYEILSMGKTAGKDIVVRMGGLDWTPTYLSKDKSGDLILTLWLNSNFQSAWKNFNNRAAEGEYYGFAPYLTGSRACGLYSTFSAGWYLNLFPTDEYDYYAANAYATSYLRVVTLNAGGSYTTLDSPNSEAESYADVGVKFNQYEQSPDNVFAEFTMGALTQFLDKPADVTWQEFGQGVTLGAPEEGTMALSNDNWSQQMHSGLVDGDPFERLYVFAVDDTSEGTTNYNSQQCTSWKDDYLWLPSVSEIGLSQYIGIWNTSEFQQVNHGEEYVQGAIGEHELSIEGILPGTLYLTRSGAVDGLDICLTDGSQPISLGEGKDNGLKLENSPVAVRPALHLNLTKAITNVVEGSDPSEEVLESLDKVSTDENNPNIYKVESESGIDFHIKSANGFLALSNHTKNGKSFDPAWSFYLDEDINLIVDETVFNTIGYYDAEAGTSNPFLGTFDGQGHNINFVFSYSFIINGELAPGVDEDYILSCSRSIVYIFGAVGKSSIKNLNLTNDIFAFNSSGLIGYCLDKCYVENVNINLLNSSNNLLFVLNGWLAMHVPEYATLNVSHVKLNCCDSMSGSCVCQADGVVNFYDFNMECEKVWGEYGFDVLGSFNDVSLNSCKITVRSTSNDGVYEGKENRLCAGNNIVMNNTFVDITSNRFEKIFAGGGNVTCSECQFQIRGEQESCQFADCINIKLYDTIIKYDNLSTLFKDSNYPGENSKCYYSGVYLYDPKTKTVTILDPNFTSYKWCADPHLNNGLPQLKRFVSIGEFMEQCDMNDWIASLK